MKIEFQKQFTGLVTQGGDCGPTSLIHAKHYATENELSPTQREIRERGKIPVKKNYATNMDDLQGAWNAHKPLAKKLGWELGGFHVCENRPGRDLLEDLKRGRGAILFVNYETWNELLPKKSGDLEFDRMHAIFVAPEFKENTNSVLVYDGMFDGRRDMPTGAIAPKGPQWIPWGKLIKCAEEYTSGSGITYAWVAKAKRIVKEEPVKDDCAAEVQAARVPLENKIESLEGQVAELQINIAARNEAIKQTVFDLAKAQDMLRAVVTE